MKTRCFMTCLLIVLLEVPLNIATAHWPHRRTLALGALLFGIGFGALAFAWDFWSAAATVQVMPLPRLIRRRSLGGNAGGAFSFMWLTPVSWRAVRRAV